MTIYVKYRKVRSDTSAKEAVENQAKNRAERELTITRVFDAPRELVFQA